MKDLWQLATLGAALLSGGATAAAHRRSASSGDVIVIGGALDDSNTEVWNRIVQAGGGRSSKFGVITAASIPKSQDRNAGDASKCSNSECNGAFYVNLLQKNGAGSAEWIPIDLDKADAAEDNDLADRVGKYTGFFIGGGDQTRLTDLFIRRDGSSDTAVLAAVRRAIQGGAGVAGTSAGAAVLQRGPMVTGGESYYAVRDGSAPASSSDANKLTYRPAGGFGFFGQGLIDTHFGSRGREGRLIRLLADTKQSIGFGVDENTALVSSNGKLSVLGANNVHLFTMGDATVGNSRDWDIRTVRWSLLASGDQLDSSGKVLPGGASAPQVGDRGKSVGRPGLAADSHGDLFSSPDNKDGKGSRQNPYQMVDLAHGLVLDKAHSSVSGETFELRPQYQVTLSLGRSFNHWSSPSTNKADSFSDLVIDIASLSR